MPGLFDFLFGEQKQPQPMGLWDPTLAAKFAPLKPYSPDPSQFIDQMRAGQTPGINPDAPQPQMPQPMMPFQPRQEGFIDRLGENPLFNIGLGLLGTGRFDTGLQQGLMAANQASDRKARRGLLDLQTQQYYTQMRDQQRKRDQAAKLRQSLPPDSPLADLPDEALIQAAGTMATRRPERPIVAGNRVLDPNDPSKVIADLRETPEERRRRLEDEAEIKGRIDRPQFGLQPFWGVDEQGNPVAMQLNNRGGVQRIPMPPGVNAAGQFEKVDLGTEFALIDRQTRQVVQRLPKNVAGEAAATAAGKGAGEQMATAPNALATGQMILKNIEAVENHPALSMGTGLTSWTQALPGTPMKDFGERVDQLRGQAFLEAFNSLKGGGAITEAEGKKASEAIARLNTAKSEKDFRTALKDLREVVTIGMERAQQRLGTGQQLGVPGMTAPPGTPPATSGKPGGRLKFNPATGEIE